MLHHEDDAGPGSPVAPPEAITVTRLHDFNCPHEQERYRSGLRSLGIEPVFVERDDGIMPEAPGHSMPCLSRLRSRRARHMVQVTQIHVCNLARRGTPGRQPWMVCVEPSRTIEADDPVEPYGEDGEEVPAKLGDAVLALQRAPEYLVWRLPPGRPVAVLTSCDGFDSNLAVPSYERLSRVLSHPEKYLGESPLEAVAAQPNPHRNHDPFPRAPSWVGSLPRYTTPRQGIAAASRE